MMDAFGSYGHAIVSLAVLAIVGLVMAPVSAIGKMKLGLAPGAEPAADYGCRVYRLHRAYLNLSETMGFFVAVTVAAILAGANPFAVNLLASLFLASRLIMAVVHVGGLGKPNGSTRSILYMAGMIMCAVLGMMAILGALA